MANLELRKYLKYVLALTVLSGILFFVHYYGSRYAKDALTTELKKLFGNNVSIDDLNVSIFPLRGNIEGLSIADEQGNQLIKLKSATAYLRILPLVFKRITIQKLYVDSLFLDADAEHVEQLTAKLKKDKKSDKSATAIEIISFDLRQSSLKFKDKGRHYAVSIADLKGQFTSREMWARLSDIDFDSSAFKHIPGKRPRINAITFKVLRTASSGGDSYQIGLLSFMADGAEIRAKGDINGDKIQLDTKANIKMDYLKQVLGLKGSGIGEVKLSGTVGYDIDEPTLDVSVEGKIHVETLLEILGENEPIFGETDFKGKIAGKLKTMKATGEAHMTKGGFYGVEVDTLSCGIVYENFKLRFHDGKARLYNGQATHAEAVLNMPRVNYFTLNVDVDAVDSAPVFKLIQWDPGVSQGKVSGHLESAGRLFNPDVKFKFVRLNTNTSRPLSALNVIERIDEIAGSVSVRGDNVTIHEANIKTPLTDGKITGTLNTKTDALNLLGAVRTKEAADLLRPYSEDLHGAGTYEGNITGTGKSPYITGTINLSKGSLFDIDYVRSKSSIRYVKERLIIEDGEATLNTGSCTYSGGASMSNPKHIFDFTNPVIAVSINAKEVAIKELAKKHPTTTMAEGLVNSSFKITGTPQRLRFDGDFDIPALTASKANIGRLTSSFVYEADTIKLGNLHVIKGGSTVTADMTVLKKGRPWHDIKTFTYNVKSKSCSINTKDTPFAPVMAEYAIDGAFDCSFNGEGSLNAPALTFNATTKGLKAKGVNTGQSNVNGTIAGDDIELKGTLLDGRVSAAGRLTLSKTLPWSANVSLKKGNYESYAAAFMKDIPPEVKLYLEGKAALSGTRVSMAGTVTMPVLNLSAGEFTFANTAPIALSIADRAITFNSFSLRSGQAKFVITGGLVAGRSFNLRLDGSPKLKFFQGLSEKISHLNGDANISLSLAGEWKTPQIRGETEIKDGSIGFKNNKYFITEINGRLNFDSNKMVVNGFAGKVGGGSLSASGAVNLDGFHIRQFYLDGKLKDMPLTDPDGFKLKYHGDVAYRGDTARQTLSGAIVVDMARYTKTVSWQDIVFGGRNGGQSASTSAFKDTQLNVSIKGDKNIAIDNNIAETNLKLDVILRGTPSQPLVYGRVTAAKGKVRFMNREFDINHANLDFPGSSDINPYLNIMAETSMKGYNIRMFLDGQLKRFNLTMTSEPKLKEADILKLFAGPDGGSTAAASIITGKYQNIVEDRIKSITGLNRFEVSASQSEDKSTVTPQVTISKKFLNNKLNVLMTSGTTKGEVIKLEYKIDQNTLLVGERNEIGNLGADVKFRFTFK